MGGYRDLRVWQLGVEICLRVYEATKNFPESERFGITAQMRRAAVSIPSNLAEGHTRDSTKEYLRHVSIARGSLAELETQITIANQLGFLNDAECRELSDLGEEESRMLTALRASLRRRLKS